MNNSKFESSFTDPLFSVDNPLPNDPAFLRPLESCLEQDSGHYDMVYSSLTAVHSHDNGYMGWQPVAWSIVENCRKAWIGTLASCCNLAEIMLKTVLNTIESNCQ